MDEYIWSDHKGHYFVEDSHWVENATTKLPKGTELTRYSETTKQAMDTYFASDLGNWIKY